jgi:hypothetical protein
MKTSAKFYGAANTRLKKQRKLREEIKTEQPAAANVEPKEDAVRQAAMEAVMKLFGVDENAPSFKRQMAALFASILLSVGAGYVIGQIAGYAIIGILALGGSMLWAYLIMILATLLAMYAGMKIGQYVGNYVLSGQVDEDIAKAKDAVSDGWNWIKSKFSSEPKESVPGVKVAIQ